VNAWLISAALLTLLIGAVHSVLGETRIFRHLRQGGLVPTRGEPLLREFQLRILWGSWHLVTCFGLGVCALLVLAAQPDVPPALRDQMVWSAVLILLAAALLVVGATRGRHPAWLALLVTASLALAGIV
jgi:hypothetical protein